jgi:hypothetical protein
MCEAVLTGTAVPSLGKKGVGFGGPRNRPARWCSYLCEFLEDYFAEGEADLDWSGFAAGLRLSIGTVND